MMNSKTLSIGAVICLGGLVLAGCDKGSDTTPPAVSNAQSSADHQDAKSMSAAGDSMKDAGSSMKDAASKTGDAIKSETSAASEKANATTMPSMSTPSTMP